jgi:hypothetical protein
MGRTCRVSLIRLPVLLLKCIILIYLRATTDPVLKALLEALPDDEPETEEERRAVQEAREELARGEVQTLEEVRRELGL